MLVVHKVRKKLNGWRNPLKPGSMKTKTLSLMRYDKILTLILGGKVLDNLTLILTGGGVLGRHHWGRIPVADWWWILKRGEYDRSKLSDTYISYEVQHNRYFESPFPWSPLYQTGCHLSIWGPNYHWGHFGHLGPQMVPILFSFFSFQKHTLQVGCKVCEFFSICRTQNQEKVIERLQVRTNIEYKTSQSFFFSF